MIVPGAALVVSARVAAALELAVADAEARARRDGVQVDAEVAQVLDELHDLAGWWRGRTSVASAAVDNAAEAGASSPAMTVNEAAAVLGMSASRIRQRLRSGELAGERTNGRWHVQRAALSGRTDRE